MLAGRALGKLGTHAWTSVGGRRQLSQEHSAHH